MKIISMATLAPMYPTFQKYGAGKILHMFFFFAVSYAHQDCVYVIKTQ